MATTVEIVKVEATDAYLADHSVVKPTLSIVGQTPGLLASYHGVGVQEPKSAYIINVWESLAHHQVLVDDKEKFPQVLENLKAMSAKLEYLVHATFNASPYAALNAPTTEFARWSVKEGVDKKVFEEKVDKLVKLAVSWGSSAGIYEGGWGPVTENDNQYYVLLGWESVEVFTKAVQASPEVLDLIGQLKELADLDLQHTVLAKF